MFVSTPFSFSVNVLVISSHECRHLPHFLFIGTDLLVYFYFFLFDEVHGIVATDSEEMRHFGFIFAPADMEDQFLFGKYVAVIERAADLLLIRIELEHTLSYI